MSDTEQNEIREILLLKIEGVADRLTALKEIMMERDRLYGQRFDGLDRANIVALSGVRGETAAALAAAKEAVTKAELANEKRFEAVNEFRGQLRDMISTLISKDEVGVRFSGITEKIELLMRAQDTTKGRSDGANWLWGIIVGAVGLALGILGSITFKTK